MREEKRTGKVEVVDQIEKTRTETFVTDPPVESVEHEEHVETETPGEEQSKLATLLNPVGLLLFMILAMVVILIFVNMKRSEGRQRQLPKATTPRWPRSRRM